MKLRQKQNLKQTGTSRSSGFSSPCGCYDPDGAAAPGVQRGDMDITATLAEKFSGETQKENTKIQPSAIDSITHDTVNHLSIICLCCCELRNSVGEKLESDQLNEFRRIEVAVQNAAEKIQQLKRILQAHPPSGNARQAEPLFVDQKQDMNSTPPCLALSHAD